MNPESLARIDTFLVQSAMELFASHGVRISEAKTSGEAIEEPFASTIGFTASSMVGVLVLTMGRDLAGGSLPANLRSASPTTELLADWAGELSNQMLGRLKNRFHSVGVEISLSTPTVFAGRDLKHFAHPSPLYRSLHFGGAGRLLVEFQADYERDFEIGEAVAKADEGPPEGEVMFF
jgi:CheY-specific phosphatase CheX